MYVDGRHEVQIRNFIATQGDVMLTMSVSGLRDFWWEVLQEGQEIAALMANSSASARRS